MVFQIQDSLNVNMQLQGKKKILPATSTEDLFEWDLEKNAGLILNKQLNLKLKFFNKRKNCFLAAQDLSLPA